ncbi:frizzled-4 [Schistocerca nitens]|uniref:frizzled-4 n=1 Tax=Schistocerca nitens TaxID=7011 RepID=UPI002118AEA5|nr:frizzled-4 [Schistocerca nitens]
MCRGIGYNHTGLSALAQKEAEFMLQSFNPLVQYGCSAQLQLLLCAVFAPMCTDKVAAPIGPCRGLCHAVRRRCLPVLQGFGFPWPASLNCSLFPADNNHETILIAAMLTATLLPPPIAVLPCPGPAPAAYAARHAALSRSPLDCPHPLEPRCLPSLSSAGRLSAGSRSVRSHAGVCSHTPGRQMRPVATDSRHPSPQQPSPQSFCPVSLRIGQSQRSHRTRHYSRHSSSDTFLIDQDRNLIVVVVVPEGPPGVPSRCQPACDADVAWAAAEKRLAEAWATGWAAVGFAASLGAALTLVGGGGGGRGRQGGGGAGSSGAASARSPPAVAFLALSHNLCAVGWAVRAAAGRRAVACSAAHALLMTRDGLANANCAVVFLLLYYFGTAASVWWVVLCLSWFLSAGGGWSAERVQQQSSLFHLAGWGLPAVCTVAVLVLRHVDADELTGSCYVGNHSARSLLVFVVVPQLAWLCAGCALLAAGWLGCRRRRGAAARMRTLGPDAKLNQVSAAPPHPPPICQNCCLLSFYKSNKSLYCYY